MLKISVRKIDVVDMSAGGGARGRGYDWVAWDDNKPGVVAATMFDAVGGFVRQQLQFAKWDWHPEMIRIRRRLLRRFPLKHAVNDSYLTDLGKFCVTRGREIGVSIHELHSKTSWGFRNPEVSDGT
ncbi:MAG TPA: hypothetical protein VLE93_03020 [Candidatus Saccharimonadales bacterium]|nr:hypothetical protein [Candidatus Saccharimonadales bacterium]